jgi:hypothetical protein
MGGIGHATPQTRVRHAGVLLLSVAATTTDVELTSSWWLAVLLGLAAMAAAAATASHQRGRRRQRDALRDQVLLDVDWLIDVSAEPPTPGDLGPRIAAIRWTADHLHHTLGLLAADSDRETTTAALQLRDAARSLTVLTVERLSVRVGVGREAEARLGEERQRVRLARLRLVEATR